MTAFPSASDPAVTFDAMAALAEEVSRLEEENAALRAELDAANDSVLELLHDLDMAP
jgi:hypothetical protein